MRYLNATLELMQIGNRTNLHSPVKTHLGSTVAAASLRLVESSDERSHLDA